MIPHLMNWITKMFGPEVPPEMMTVLKAAVTKDYPKNGSFRFTLCDSKPDSYIVRVFLNSSQIRPTPYEIYSINKKDLIAHKLSGDEAAIYHIPKYR